MIGVVEQVSDFEAESEHDSGIENGHKRKSKFLSEAADTLNVESSGSSKKRSAEEDTLDSEIERKRRKKAEKKARKEKERMERMGQIQEMSRSNDSSNEFKEEKPKKKKENKLKESIV